jgi:DNA-binding response OmpR family regulator
MGLPLNAIDNPVPRDPQGKVPIGEESREPKVFACEDSSLMREYIIMGLARFGITVAGVPNGRALDTAMSEQRPDIVILDIGLPDEDGYSIAERLKEKHPGVGIVMLTAWDQLEDRVRGLDAGADIYLAKPVEMRELASAVRSLYRRLLATKPGSQPGTWRLNPLTSTLAIPSGATICLTDNELRFLNALLEHPGEVVDRAELFRVLGHKPDMYAKKRLETLLSRLRNKIQKASPGESLPVRAQSGHGYVFLGETDERKSAKL